MSALAEFDEEGNLIPGTYSTEKGTFRFTCKSYYDFSIEYRETQIFEDYFVWGTCKSTEYEGFGSLVDFSAAVKDAEGNVFSLERIEKLEGEDYSYSYILNGHEIPVSASTPN